MYEVSSDDYIETGGSVQLFEVDWLKSIDPEGMKTSGGNSYLIFLCL